MDGQTNGHPWSSRCKISNEEAERGEEQRVVVEARFDFVTREVVKRTDRRTAGGNSNSGTGKEGDPLSWRRCNLQNNDCDCDARQREENCS